MCFQHRSLSAIQCVISMLVAHVAFQEICAWFTQLAWRRWRVCYMDMSMAHRDTPWAFFSPSLQHACLQQHLPVAMAVYLFASARSAQALVLCLSHSLT